MKEIQIPAQIFLSYTVEDTAYYDLFKKHLSESVRKRELELWSPHQTEPGKNIEEETTSYMEHADLLLLFFSPDYLANDACYRQLQQAIQIGELEPERVSIILLRPCAWMQIWTGIEHKEHFLFLPHSGQAISFRPMSDRDDAMQGIASDITRRVIRMQRTGSASPGPRVSTTPPLPPEEMHNPYLALRSFGIGDEASFYGRERQTRETLEKIEDMLRTRNTAQEQRLLAIIGASGAGKSSLLHAGVLPHLIRGELTGSESWIILRTLYPGDQPLDNLADVLYDYLSPEERRDDIKGILASSTSGLNHLVHQIVRLSQPRRAGHISANPSVVLVIDQFEECLTQDNYAECTKFIDLLFTAATRRDVPLLILMTCRADFYQELMGHDNFFRLLRQHEVVLNQAMTFSEMRTAIEAPLRALNSALQFEKDLVDQIIVDLQGQKEALPLLQFTLFELFEQRQSFTLTRQAYNEMSGGRGALAAHAEKIYESFQDQQEIVRRLFLSLIKVSMSEDQEFIAARQRVDYHQLLQSGKPANSAEHTHMDKMLNAFINARLFTSNLLSHRQNNQRTLEISHEILLQAWPRLAGWVRENGETLYKKSRATQDAHNWQRNNRPQKDLYRGQQLQDLKNIVKQNFIAADEPLRTFLHGSQVRQHVRNSFYAGVVCLMVLILSSVGFNIFSLLASSNQISVISAADTGPGTLREALSKARPGETIALDAGTIGSATIILQQDLDFAANDDGVTLRDNGVTLTAPAGQQLHILPEISVAFDHVLVAHSQPAPHRAQGGVIFNQGQLRLISCTIAENSSNYNGGALVNTSILTLDDHTTFSGNTTPGYGGAIYNLGGYIDIRNRSSLTDNSALIGGGLYSQGGEITITNSFISKNRAGKGDGSRYFGGGLALRNAKLDMRSSIVQSNHVYGDGGGISLLDSSANLNASTITQNLAIVTDAPDNPSWGGGGIAVDTATAQGSSSQALIMNTAINNKQHGIAGYISGNAVQSGKYFDSTANILGRVIPNQGTLPAIVVNQKNPVLLEYPTSKGTSVESLTYHVGNIDLNLFCQTQGYSQGDPTPDDLEDITCISPLEATQNEPRSHQYLAILACQNQYNTITGSMTTRLYNYYDPSTWECYRKIKLDFSFTEQNMETLLNSFCQNKYQPAGLYNNLPRITAYDWECTNIDGKPIGINMTEACRRITQNNQAFERLARFNDPYGWECWVPVI